MNLICFEVRVGAISGSLQFISGTSGRILASTLDANRRLNGHTWSHLNSNDVLKCVQRSTHTKGKNGPSLRLKGQAPMPLLSTREGKRLRS